MKYPVLECSMFSDLRRGIYTVWTYYSDGSMETTYVPRGPILFFPLGQMW